MTTSNQRERILAKAYEIWEAEGRPNDRDMEHWFQAELQIAQENAKPARKPAAKPKAKPAAKPKAKPAAKPKAKPAAKPKAKPAAKAKPKAKA